MTKNNQTGTYIIDTGFDPSEESKQNLHELLQDRQLEQEVQAANAKIELRRTSFRTAVDNTKLTDPVESFNCVKSHFEKIQQNFTSMRQGIT